MELAGELALLLDLRLLGRPQPGPAPIDHAAATITRIWRAHRGDRFSRPDGTPTPSPGPPDCVLRPGTPSDTKWNAYHALRERLVARGIPREAIRFVHDAATDAAKAALFAAARNGEVAVLIGSTEKMGVGTNVQVRAVALHHLGCPWRPADLHQRDGRTLRQGNPYAEVEIYRYIVEGSFDGYLYQTLARKSAFIDQVMRGRLDVREIDDIGEATLSFDEVKALASGDPRVIEKARLDAEVATLDRLEVVNRAIPARSMVAASRQPPAASRQPPVLGWLRAVGGRGAGQAQGAEDRAGQGEGDVDEEGGAPAAEPDQQPTEGGADHGDGLGGDRQHGQDARGAVLSGASGFAADQVHRGRVAGAGAQPEQYPRGDQHRDRRCEGADRAAKTDQRGAGEEQPARAVEVDQPPDHGLSDGGGQIEPGDQPRGLRGQRAERDPDRDQRHRLHRGVHRVSGPSPGSSA